MTNAAEPVLFTIGDISVTEHWIITPRGSAPIAGSAWTMQPAITRQERIPGWAIVVAILFIWMCLLSLLFLLVKTEVVSGWCDVTVETPGFMHSTRVMIGHGDQIVRTGQLVDRARQLAYTATLGQGF